MKVRSYSSSTPDPSFLMLERGLAGAAVTPVLRKILLYDIAEMDFRALAHRFGNVLAAVEDRPVEVVFLNAFENEDTLWGRWLLHKMTLRWQPGHLKPQDGKLRVLAIPNLAALSLVARRACTALMDADTAHYEQHGLQEAWSVSPLVWLGASASDDIGRISTHLLDRFALHLDASAVFDIQSYHQRIWEWANRGQDKTEETQEANALWSLLESSVLRQTAQRVSSIPTPDAMTHLLEMLDARTSMRRVLGAVRLSMALARLDKSAETTLTHVSEALKVMGLTRAAVSQPLDDPQSQTPIMTPTEISMPGDEIDDTAVREGEVDVFEPTISDDLIETVPDEDVRVQVQTAQRETAEHEYASLRPPTRRFQRGRAANGVVVGIEQADGFEDIATFQTIFEAAKFQYYRRNQQQKAEGYPPGRLIVYPTDLRSYKRAPGAQGLLMIVIDFTSLRAVDWQDTLVYYLGQAYEDRMRIGVVSVGAADAPHPLKAQSLMSRSLLDLRVYEAINGSAGRTTPLAHGLELAYEHLRTALHPGRQTVSSATLVLLTDGLGNVPLINSKTNSDPVPPVGSKGVEDALQMAECLAGLADLKIVFLVAPRNVADIPRRLESALHTTAQVLPRLEDAGL